MAGWGSKRRGWEWSRSDGYRIVRTVTERGTRYVVFRDPGNVVFDVQDTLADAMRSPDVPETRSDRD